MKNSILPYCDRCCTNHWGHNACARIAGEKQLRDTNVADPPVYGHSSKKMDRDCAVCGPVVGPTVLIRIPSTNAGDADSDIVCFDCMRKLAFDSLEDRIDPPVPICTICRKACDIMAGNAIPLKGSVMQGDDSHHAHFKCCRKRAYQVLKGKSHA